MILLIFVVCAAPIVLGTAAYFILKPQNKMNYGELLPTRTVTMPVGSDANGAVISEPSYRGKWWIVHYCKAVCDEELYASRQAHTMLGRERERVARVVVTPLPPSQTLREAHPHVRWIVASDQAGFSPSVTQTGIWFVDPLGNQVLRWPTAPDIKKLQGDMMRLLRTSRIG
jgi:hypothetical protein